MKRVLKWGLAFIAFLMVFGIWYNWKYAMGIANSYTVNSPKIENKLLIATQQSEYKDKVTKYITDHFNQKNLYISVIDATELNKVGLDDFQAFVIIHTNQMWMPPKEVSAFLLDQDKKSKTFIISTSGPGDLITEGVDGVSSASVIIDAEQDASKAIDWINNQFRKGT